MQLIRINFLWINIVIKRISTIIISCMLAFFLVEILTRLMFPMFDPTGNLVFENKSGFVQLEHKNSYRRQSKNSGDYLSLIHI